MHPARVVVVVRNNPRGLKTLKGGLGDNIMCPTEETIEKEVIHTAASDDDMSEAEELLKDVELHRSQKDTPEEEQESEGVEEVIDIPKGKEKEYGI